MFLLFFFFPGVEEMLWWRRFVRGRHEAGYAFGIWIRGVVQPLARVQHGVFSYLFFLFSYSLCLLSNQAPAFLPTFDLEYLKTRA